MPLLEKIRGLNDAVTDEDFEMGPSRPMDRYDLRAITSYNLTYNVISRHITLYKTFKYYVTYYFSNMYVGASSGALYSQLA